MSHPTDEIPDPTSSDDYASDSVDPSDPDEVEESSAFEVEEQTPDGGRTAAPASPAAAPVHASSETAPSASSSSNRPVADDDDPAPELVWYVLKVQSSREDTIRDALERRVKIQGLQQYFGRIVVPTENFTEIRNNKRKTVKLSLIHI